MLVEKEVIGPGTYFYVDEATGSPRKLEVTPELCRYWHDQGGAMLASGLTIPVPYEHDFSSHPMTPKDKLLNNAGWITGYRLHDGVGGPGDKLHALLDVQDEEVAKKLPTTIRWTSPWINSFTDGNGRKWNNVISHLALTTRPRITRQQPFGSVAAALSVAAPVGTYDAPLPETREGFCLSRAGRIYLGRRSRRLRPRYPLAFSMWFAAEPGKKPQFGATDGDAGGSATDAADSAPDQADDMPPEESGESADTVDLPPLGSAAGDVSMEEVLCDLLEALGVHCEHSPDPATFKRNLYTSAMAKVHELAGKGAAAPAPSPQPGSVGKDQQPGQGQPGQGGPGAAGAGGNPLIKQEQQPMYMGLDGGAGGGGMATLSIDDINRIEDSTMRTVALAMFNENQTLRRQLEANTRTTDSLRAAKLGEASKKRADRIAMLCRLSPKVKEQLDGMVAQAAMSLSMGDDGQVCDPMRTTLDMLEAALAERVSLPRLLQGDYSGVVVQPHPTDADALSAEGEAALVDSMSRMMGCAPEAKAG